MPARGGWRCSVWPSVVWVAIGGAVLTLLLVVTAPLMPDRLLAAFPADVIPQDAVVRETRLTGPSAIQWYEVAGEPDAIEDALRRDLRAHGWSIDKPADSMVDVRAVSPDGRLDAAIGLTRAPIRVRLDRAPAWQTRDHDSRDQRDGGALSLLCLTELLRKHTLTVHERLPRRGRLVGAG